MKSPEPSDASLTTRLADADREIAQLRQHAARLERLDSLRDTLAGVLDVRQVFDRVSAIAQEVLPHDAIAIIEATDEGRRIRYHASHGLGTLPEPRDYPLPDSTLWTERWNYRLIDDVGALPHFAETRSAQAGMRSLIAVAIRFEGTHFGGLNFYSRTPGFYKQEDVLIARRITDHVALALAHARLARQQQDHIELLARSTHLELLDDVLSALVDSSDLRDVFPRISAVAQKVLPHDAVSLMVKMPDGRHAKAYAMAGYEPGAPTVNEIPDDLLAADPNWQWHILDDLTGRTAPLYIRLTREGFRSLLRVPVRFDKQFRGGLMFLSRTPGAFQPSDVATARKLADRMVIPLAHDRELEASRRADEATARAVQLEARVKALTHELDARTGARRVIGESKELRQVLTQATQVAATDTTVLLLGESGTGKEVIARFVHHGSPRKGGPFIALNCAALPEQLLEAELFGYERGAYTGATQSKPGQLEQAAGGTLFLDEVAEMSFSAQAKFLRVLQEKEFQRLGGTRILRTDARIIAATNRDLPKMIANGQFREDLYYRLNVFAIRIPPLRDRRDDILPMSAAFLTDIGRGLGRPASGISRDARALLIDYHWPGNVRELRNVLERAAILCDGGLITPEHLALAPLPQVAPPVAPVSFPPVSAAATNPGAAGAAPASVASGGDLSAMERTMIEQALQNARYNKSRAAKALGLTRHQLYIRMRKHGFK